MTEDSSLKNIKPSYDTNRQILGHIYPLNAPFNLIIDTSEACNFRCNYCFRSNPEKKDWSYAALQNLMSFDLFEKVVDQIGDFSSIKQISLSNHGEPLCNRRVPAMARYLRDQGFAGRISIHTNGSLLDRDYAKELGDSGLSRIVISVQGLDSEKYSNVCDYAIDYDSFIDNIRILFETSRHADIRTEIDIKIADIALDEGEDEEFYKLFSPYADRVFIEHIVPIWKNVGTSDGDTVNKFGQSFLEQKCCPLAFHTIVVSPDGNVYPCTQLLNDHCLGNINEDRLFDLWNSDRRTDMLKKILLLNPPKMCENCFILQNSIYAKEDMIDDYRLEILNRLSLKENES